MEEAATCVVEHCYRESNSLADELAKMDTGQRLVEIDVFFLSYKFNQIIEREKRENMYERVL